ncbi:TonB-linked outer membrane protein, SusC/RagA family [Chryseolinea serpens]|uniref:TonB-linked outer membrane protein, SusC/RagA family n=2 Tax=Chryseolinea serpens TaxID=947013 RepID=A0A1M5UT06_9BACT|nr:TonB-linked outer membrane protein, SusC/RagA family [Chryseolinea serpens]
MLQHYRPHTGFFQGMNLAFVFELLHSKPNKGMNKPIPKKIIALMRLTLIQAVMAGIFSVWAYGFESKGQEILDRKISVHVEKKSIKSVLQFIEQEAQVKFTYQSQLIRSIGPVSMAISDVKVSDALAELLGPSISYEVDGNQIILKPAPTAEEPASSYEQAVRMQSVVTVTGQVTDTDGQALPGSNVVVKGTNNGVTTDSDGKFTLSVPNEESVLVISFIGYASQEVVVGSQTTIHVIMVPELQSLNEVVVVGYGTQRKQDVTGSISSIKADDLKTQGSNTIQKSLQGRAAGVQVESAGGEPGSGVKILIRGTGSLNSNNPLYIVDGVQVDNINNLNPSDVQSMDILKDASAAAIYGSRASNGVVLITTKSGAEGDIKIDFSSYVGVANVTKKMDVLNATDWAAVSNAAHDNAGLARLDAANNPAPTTAGTDWQKQIYHTAPVQNYTLSAGGGGKNYNFNVSGGYLNQDGIVKNTNYERINLRMKSEFTKGIFKFGQSFILTRENARPQPPGLGGQGGNPVEAATKMIPVFNVYDPAAVGGYSGAYGPVVDVANPVASLNLQKIRNNTNTAILNMFTEVTLLEGLKYKYNFGYTNTAANNFNYIAPYQVGALFVNQLSKLTEFKSQNNYFLQEHTLNYTKTFGKHSLQALGGFTYQNTQYRTLTGYKTGMPNGIEVLDAGTANASVGSNAKEYALLSYLGRLVYSYDNRYVITGTFRRDGSSRFGNGYKYGTFPSVALAWNASNEDFFSVLEPVVTNLKVRASYGVLGNQEIPDYLYSPTINSNINYVTGQDQHLWNGSTQTAFATPNIKWESSKTFDIGTDWGFFGNKLNLTADYFIRKNTDILLQVPLPLSSGASGSNPYVNAGSITNKGLELALNYNNQVNDFKYQLTGTFTAINNEVTALGTGSQQIFGGQPTHHGASATVTQAGLPVGSFYLIKDAGIFQTQEEINAYQKNGQLIQPNAKPGDIKFEDANGDGVIDQNDRQYAGSPTPKFSYGFGGNAAWKNFDVTIFFQGTQGNKIYNGFRQDLESMSLEENYAASTKNAWTPTNTNTDMPRAVINDPNYNSQTSTRFLENGSYLRFKTLQIGYTLPKNLVTRASITSARLYVSFDNLFTITGYKGFNPDIGRQDTGLPYSVLDRGVDFGHVSYPLPRTSLFGVQLSF